MLDDVNKVCFKHEFHQQLGEQSLTPARTPLARTPIARSPRSGQNTSRSNYNGSPNTKKLKIQLLSPLQNVSNLRQVATKQFLSTQQQQHITRVLKYRKVTHGECIYYQDTPADHLCFLVSGEIILNREIVIELTNQV